MTYVSEQERQALGQCLHTLLFLVSGADGRSTSREVRAIYDALHGLDTRWGSGHLIHLDLSPTATKHARLASEGLGFHLQGNEIGMARQALDNMPLELRLEYEKFFVESCLAVAAASADYLGFGARINEDERTRLREIFLHLGFSSAEPLLLELAAR